MHYATGDKQLIKEINRSAILKLVWDKESISRAEIAKTLGLTPATISGGIAALIKQGIIREAGMGSSSGGRKPVLVELDENAMFFIGVDVHKDVVKAAVINIKGRIISGAELAFSKDENGLKECLNAAIHKVRAASGVQADKFYGIGIAMNGIVDINQDISVFVPAMDLRNVAIKPYIEQEQNLPVMIDNDANVMALGEQEFGKAKNLSDFIFINVGKGVGAGLVMNGKLYYGKSYAAGEMGHIRVCENGRKCVCGKHGCLDTVATEPGLLYDVKERIMNGEQSEMSEMVQGDLEQLTLQTVLTAADRGDECAQAALGQVGSYIGIAISYIINILNPERLIIGGSMSQAGAHMMKPLLHMAHDMSMAESIDGVDIILSSLGGDAGVIGAASMIIKQYLKDIVSVSV